MECHVSVWGVLAFLSLALIVSLILNISHYLKKKQGESGMITKGLLAAQPAAENYLNPFSEGKPTEQAQDNMCKDYEDNSPSYDYYAEDDPVYGNLNQDIFVTEECCYEQMKSQPQRPVNQLQVEPTNQMCYASLDHSVKRKCRKPRRKKDPSLEEDEERSSNPSMIASQVSIYLNSEQLAAENRGHS